MLVDGGYGDKDPGRAVINQNLKKENPTMFISKENPPPIFEDITGFKPSLSIFARGSNQLI